VTFSTLIEPCSNSGVGVAFTDRLGGVSLPPYDSLNLGRSDVDDPEHLARNFQIVSERLGVGSIAICSQVHGTHVEPVTSRPPTESGHLDGVWISCVQSDGQIRVADALVTTVYDVALAIRVADCVPVLLADAEAGVVAAAHAGRVGLLSQVVESTVGAMRTLGATNIRAWIGPHICASCYEVPPDMARQAWEKIPATRAFSRTGTPAIDLGSGVESILESESVLVTRCDPCTSCDPHFFSHRRDKGQTGRQAGLIWLTAR